jgi:hypothetical protein
MEDLLVILANEINPHVERLLFANVCLSQEVVDTMTRFEKSLRNRAAVWTRWVRADRAMLASSYAFDRFMQLCQLLVDRSTFSPISLPVTTMGYGEVINLFFDVLSLLSHRPMLGQSNVWTRLAASADLRYRSRHADEYVSPIPKPEPFDTAATVSMSAAITKWADWRTAERRPGRLTLREREECEPFFNLLAFRWTADDLFKETASLGVLFADQIGHQICRRISTTLGNGLSGEAGFFGSQLGDLAAQHVFALRLADLCREINPGYSRAVNAEAVISLGRTRGGLDTETDLRDVEDAVRFFTDVNGGWNGALTMYANSEFEDLVTKFVTDTSLLTSDSLGFYDLRPTNQVVGGERTIQGFGRALALLVQLDSELSFLRLSRQLVQRLHDSESLVDDESAGSVFFARLGIAEVLGPLGFGEYPTRKFLALAGYHVL